VRSSVSESLRQLTDSDWFELGRRSAPAYACHQNWLFRRVETIEFVGRRSVKRSVSVDFERAEQLPDPKPLVEKGACLVPISVLQKWPPLMDFKLTDPHALPASLYLRTTRKRLDFGLLLGMADLTLRLGEGLTEDEAVDPAKESGPERLPAALRRKLADVVEDPVPQQKAVESAVNGLGSELERQLGDALEGKQGDLIEMYMATTVDLAARLAGSSILWVVIHGKPRSDQIVKFSYLGSYSATRPKLPGESKQDKDRWKGWRVVRWWKWLAIRCSWRPRTVSIPLLHAGREVRYHLDVRAPQGTVELVEAKALAFQPATPDSGHQNASVRSVSSLARLYPELDVPDEWVGPESGAFYMDYGKPPKTLAATPPRRKRRRKEEYREHNEASAEIVDRRAHVYLGPDGAPSHRVHLQLKLAAPRQGFIRGCTLSAGLIFILMWTTYFTLEAAAIHLDATAVLLSVVPVVLGYVLVRPGEEALERYHVTGVRLMAVLSGGMPILGALTLVLTHHAQPSSEPDLSVAQPIWLVLAIFSTVLALCLVASFILAAPSKEPNEGAAGTDPGPTN
jgi:hypothetical protein